MGRQEREERPCVLKLYREAATRDDDHGGGDDVVGVEVPGHVEVAFVGVAAADEPRRSRPVPGRRAIEALGEGEVVVAVPASERRNLAPPAVATCLHRRS